MQCPKCLSDDQCTRCFKRLLKLDKFKPSADGRSQSIKTFVLFRDEGKCLECGTDKNISTHHVIALKDGGEDEINNVITLCFDCHAEKHKDNKGIYNQFKSKGEIQ
jgi:5-methylcytosine-specific restriction endonuclease McrA